MASSTRASATSSRWRRGWRHGSFLLGLAVTAGILGVAAVSLVYTPYDPREVNVAARLEAPSRAHPMGTDNLGRDIVSRVMDGARASLIVGTVAVAVGLGVGALVGMAGGYFGGWVDEALMRVMDAVYGFPAVLSALLVAAVFRPGMVITMLAVGVAFVPIFARLTRGSFLALREQEFVLAARALGARDWAIIGRHILPNTLSPLIVQATISFPLAILAEAALSYLGLGVQPPDPSWGRMLKDAQDFLGSAPWYAVFPGAAIALAVLGFNLLGDGLRDLLDPRAS